MKAENQEPAMSFEEAMEKLESIVDRLEGGDVPLETAIDLFQEGMKLSQLCGGKLEQVEKRIETLLESGSEFQTQPFSAAQNDREDVL
ncbi:MULTISPECIES: exodeoxyribonuclease VII small subunit [Paenibacillus]|uniref:exodeoxyribonuclease VII small subunit n=1 Tax=Paenibacillus TaxID=44249 RepID=UPI0003FC21F7|nr:MULTISPECIES: exodeoxyribonuclease VII small subunit [Paenibacillus]KKC46185.1 exodeoxyribonuclease VII small subunit [Paenibacillus sp. D9]